MANELHALYTTGSTLYVQIYSAAGTVWNGTTLTTLVTASWTDYDVAMTETSGSGHYFATFPAGITTAGTYFITAYKQAGGSPAASDTVVSQGLLIWDGDSEVTNILSADVPGNWAQGSLAYALGRIGTGNVVVISPVAQDSKVTIIKGDDYSATDSRALDWTDTTALWPTLTGATITLNVFSEFDSSTALLTVTGSVITATGSNKQVRVALTAAQTATLAAGGYLYEITATISSRVITLVRAQMEVQGE